jgi:hypothetical protein
MAFHVRRLSSQHRPRQRRTDYEQRISLQTENSYLIRCKSELKLSKHSSMLHIYGYLTIFSIYFSQDELSDTTECATSCEGAVELYIYSLQQGQCSPMFSQGSNSYEPFL